MESRSLSHVKLGQKMELLKLNSYLKRILRRTERSLRSSLKCFSACAADSKNVTLKNTSVLYLCTWFCPQRI